MKQAKNAPVVTRKVIDSSDADLGNPGVATMATTGEAKIVHEEIELTEPARCAKEKLDNLAFNEEKVTVIVAPTDDKFAPRWVEVFVNGKPQLFWRGQPTVCARKFVEGLARAKPVGYKNIEFTDPEGNRGVRWPASVGQAHHFTVVDDTPRGREWLTKLMRERA